MKSQRKYKAMFLAGIIATSTVHGTAIIQAEKQQSSPTEKEQTSPSKKEQNGLLGNFYTDDNFTDLAVLRAHSLVNEDITDDDWKKLLPNNKSSIKSVRWQGYIKPEQDGAYTFSFGEHKQVMIQVDSQIVLDQNSKEKEISLQKDQLYKIIIEYKIDSQKIDPLTLLWGKNQSEKIPVPHEALYAPDLEKIKNETPSMQEGLHRSKRSATDFITETDKDNDNDFILNSWETEGYTMIEGASGLQDLVKWDETKHPNGKDSDGLPLVKYKTSPLKWSTSDDPYSDYQKVSGLQMDTRVTKEAQHPLVAAYPDIRIEMEKYVLIPNANFQSGQGGSSNKQVTRGTSNMISNTEAWGATVTAHASILDAGVSVSASYESSKTTSVTKDTSVSDSSSEDWNTILGINQAEAGKILPNVRYINTGTAPAFDVKPQFTLHLPKTKQSDALSLITSLVGETHKGLEVLPGKKYPDQSMPALAFDKPTHFGESLLLDKGTVSRLQSGEPLKLTTNGIDSKIKLIDTQGQDYTSSQDWTPVISKIKTNSAEIVYQTSDSMVKRNISAPGQTPVEKTIPATTFKEALQIGYGAIEKNGKLFIGTQEVSTDTIHLIIDQNTENQIKSQGVSSIFDVKLKAGMHIEIRPKQLYVNDDFSNSQEYWSILQGKHDTVFPPDIQNNSLFIPQHSRAETRLTNLKSNTKYLVEFSSKLATKSAESNKAKLAFKESNHEDTSKAVLSPVLNSEEFQKVTFEYSTSTMNQSKDTARLSIWDSLQQGIEIKEFKIYEIGPN